jgi:hypothetical protein
MTEGLVLGLGRGGQVLGAFGEIEDIAVPMQDCCGRGQGADYRVGGVVHFYRREANLGAITRPYLRSQCPGQQLSAQADAQNRDPQRYRLGEPLSLGREGRMAVGFVDVHRATHRGDAGYLGVRGQRLSPQWLDGADPDPVEGIENPVRALPGRMFENQEGWGVCRHRLEASRATVGAMARLPQVALFKPELRPATMTGAQARGAVALGALAVGAAAVGGFAIGRLSVGRLAIRSATIGRLKVGELEVDRLTIHEQTPPA